jgi:hypothetical protein
MGNSVNSVNPNQNFQFRELLVVRAKLDRTGK